MMTGILGSMLPHTIRVLSQSMLVLKTLIGDAEAQERIAASVAEGQRQQAAGILPSL